VFFLLLATLFWFNSHTFILLKFFFFGGYFFYSLAKLGLTKIQAKKQIVSKTFSIISACERKDYVKLVYVCVCVFGLQINFFRIYFIGFGFRCYGCIDLERFSLLFDDVIKFIYKLKEKQNG
jgi:hypothetical protein